MKITKFLALDISTTCTGFSFWEEVNDEIILIEAGAIESPTEKFPTLEQKMDFVVCEVNKQISCLQITPDVIVAEAALKKFTGGKSTADTMSKLIAFNFCLCYALSRYNLPPILIEHLDVRAARKSVGIAIPKNIKDKKEIKKIVINHWKNKYPNLRWDLKKTGNYKDFVEDMADSITIGAAYLKKLPKK